MPPTGVKVPADRSPEAKIAEVAASSEYACEAYYFLHEGLRRAVERAHGAKLRRGSETPSHVSGQQLCESLREVAIESWGLMAIAVLSAWGIHRTQDFGKMVFALIDANVWQKTSTDTIADFKDVYDFRRAFVTDYRITLPAAHSCKAKS